MRRGGLRGREGDGACREGEGVVEKAAFLDLLPQRVASKGDHPLYSPPGHVEVLGECHVPRRLEAFHEMLISEGLEVILKTVVVNFTVLLSLVKAPMCL